MRTWHHAGANAGDRGITERGAVAPGPDQDGADNANRRRDLDECGDRISGYSTADDRIQSATAPAPRISSNNPISCVFFSGEPRGVSPRVRRRYRPHPRNQPRRHPGRNHRLLLRSALRRRGALDVWTTPIQMKKNRPGIILSVLGRRNEPARNAGSDHLSRDANLRHSPSARRTPQASTRVNQRRNAVGRRFDVEGAWARRRRCNCHTRSMRISAYKRCGNVGSRLPKCTASSRNHIKAPLPPPPPKPTPSHSNNSCQRPRSPPPHTRPESRTPPCLADAICRLRRSIALDKCYAASGDTFRGPLPFSAFIKTNQGPPPQKPPDANRE